MPIVITDTDPALLATIASNVGQFKADQIVQQDTQQAAQIQAQHQLAVQEAQRQQQALNDQNTRFYAGQDDLAQRQQALFNQQQAIQDQAAQNRSALTDQQSQNRQDLQSAQMQGRQQQDQYDQDQRNQRQGNALTTKQTLGQNNIDAANQRLDDQLNFRSQQGDANRQNRLTVAQMRAQGGGGAGAGSVLSWQRALDTAINSPEPDPDTITFLHGKLNDALASQGMSQDRDAGQPNQNYNTGPAQVMAPPQPLAQPGRVARFFGGGPTQEQVAQNSQQAQLSQAANNLSQIKEGTQVTVALPNGQTATGQFAGVDATGVATVMVNGQPVRVPATGVYPGGYGPGGPIQASQLSADPLEGRTATGPGGQKIIRRNGQWIPAQ